jgi:hypothetical protein
MTHIARQARRGLGWASFAGGNAAALSMLSHWLAH